MKCAHLAERIQRLRPDATAREVAQLCLLLTNSSDNVNEFMDDSILAEAWRAVDLRLRTATDQHQAMTEDLEELVDAEFNPEDAWRLLRAIRVQNQVLELYVGQSVT